MSESKPAKPVNPLLAELMAEFGTKPKKTANSAPKEKTAKELNKEFHARVEGSNTQAALQAYANAAARSWKEVPGFEPIARVTNIQREHCRCCGGEVEYIGNEFTRFESTRLRARVDSPELILLDELGFELPRIIEEWSHEVDQCAKCVRLSRRAEDLASLSAELLHNGAAYQLPLFIKLQREQQG